MKPSRTLDECRPPAPLFPGLASSPAHDPHHLLPAQPTARNLPRTQTQHATTTTARRVLRRRRKQGGTHRLLDANRKPRKRTKQTNSHQLQGLHQTKKRKSHYRRRTTKPAARSRPVTRRVYCAGRIAIRDQRVLVRLRQTRHPRCIKESN